MFECGGDGRGSRAHFEIWSVLRGYDLALMDVITSGCGELYCCLQDYHIKLKVVGFDSDVLSGWEKFGFNLFGKLTQLAF